MAQGKYSGKEGFTKQLEFEPRIEDQIGICWANQLEEGVPSRKEKKKKACVRHGGFSGGNCNKIQEAGA